LGAKSYVKFIKTAIMSRVGKQPIEKPNNVTLAWEDTNITVSGPMGSLSVFIDPIIQLDTSEGRVQLRKKGEKENADAIWGLTRSLLYNAVKGVTEGFKKELEIIGVGYRVELRGNDLVFSLGFSHPVHFKAPLGIQFSVEKNKIMVSGIDKQLVGETAAQIRSLKKPEPYKGKGIKYIGEKIRRKAGKTAKA